MDKYVRLYAEARIDKDTFDRRKDNFWDRMEKNKSNKKLKEPQHELLGELANMRHFIHTNQDRYYNSESSDFSKIHNFLDNLNSNLKKIKLPTINWSNSFEEFHTDVDTEYGICDDKDECYSEFIEQMNQLNVDIEKYLKDIDSKYGTNYSPTGKFRNEFYSN